MPTHVCDPHGSYGRRRKEDGSGKRPKLVAADVAASTSSAAPRTDSGNKHTRGTTHIGARDERARAVSSRAENQQQAAEHAWLDDADHISDSEPED